MLFIMASNFVWTKTTHVYDSKQYTLVELTTARKACSVHFIILLSTNFNMGSSSTKYVSA
jgi:hypothetical protein